MFTTAIRLLLVFHFATADPAAVFERARAALEAGDAAKASPLFEEAVSLAPKRAEYHDWLARSYALEAKQTANAVRLAFLGWNIGTELEEAIRLDPKYSAPYGNLALFYLQAGQNKRAHQYYKKACLVDSVLCRNLAPRFR